MRDFNPEITALPALRPAKPKVEYGAAIARLLVLLQRGTKQWEEGGRCTGEPRRKRLKRLWTNQPLAEAGPGFWQARWSKQEPPP